MSSVSLAERYDIRNLDDTVRALWMSGWYGENYVMSAKSMKVLQEYHPNEVVAAAEVVDCIKPGRRVFIGSLEGGPKRLLKRSLRAGRVYVRYNPLQRGQAYRRPSVDRKERNDIADGTMSNTRGRRSNQPRQRTLCRHRIRHCMYGKGHSVRGLMDLLARLQLVAPIFTGDL